MSSSSLGAALIAYGRALDAQQHAPSSELLLPGPPVSPFPLAPPLISTRPPPSPLLSLLLPPPALAGCFCCF